MSRLLLTSFSLLAIVFCLMLNNQLYAQNPPPAPSADAKAIEQDIRYLASDELQGRLAGSPGADKAADYIAGVFNTVGLTPGNASTGDYYQDFDITTGVSLGTDNNVEVQTSTDVFELTVQKDFMPMFFSGNGSTRGGVVFAGYGITAPDYKWDDYAKLDVNGKIVFVLRGEPSQDDPQSAFDGDKPTIYSGLRWKAMNARNRGAAALIIATGPMQVTEGNPDQLIGLDRKGGFGDAGIPVIQLSQDAAAMLWKGMDAPLEMYQAEMDRNTMPFGTPIKDTMVSLNVDLVRQQASTSNVVGILPGSDPALANQWVIVGAHYDHLGMGTDVSMNQGPPAIHPGADDNASGVAGMLELARMFTQSPKHPARSILFIGFGAEEEGQLGSGYYVQNPLVPLADTSAMINMDMIGRVRPDESGVPTCTVDGIADALEWVKIVPGKSPDGLVALKQLPAPLVGGDYVSFLRVGIPTLNFFTGLHPQYHRPTDTPDLINFTGEASLVGGIYQTIDKTADFPAKLTFQKVQTGAPTDTGAMPTRTVYVGTIPDFSKPEGGYWIEGVTPGSPAEAAGLKGGDEIVKLGNYSISNIYDYTNALSHFSPGDTAQIAIVRNNEQLTLTITFAARGGS